MKKGKTYSLILTFVIFLTIIDIAVAIPFQPAPNPLYENSEWDLTIGDIYWWNVTTYNGTQKIAETSYIFKINNTSQTQYLSNLYYAVQVNPMIYNQTGASFYRDPIYTGTVNLSLISFTLFDFYPDDVGLGIIIFIFPKDDEGLMTRLVCHNLAENFYDSYFGTDTSFGTTSNSIHLSLGSNESIKFYYDDNGFLTTGEYFTKQDLLYPDGLSAEITRILPELPGTPAPNLISFGNYYLMFIVFGVLGLLVYLKRKRKYSI